MSNSWQNEIVSRAMRDPEFKDQLINDPKAVLKEISGVDFPEDININIIENTANELNLVIPRESFPEILDPEIFLQKIKNQYDAENRPGPCTSSVKGGTCW